MPTAVRDTAETLYCITADGRTVPVTLYNHYFNTWDQYPRLEPGLLAAGAMTRTTVPGGGVVRLLDAQKTADWLVPELQRNPGIITEATLGR